ncbi:MAG: hypothetical protein QM767_09960 [Anaeromyxobacter sp.]
MIANEMLFSLLQDEDFGLKLLQVLMVAKYNLNHARNIVLLPAAVPGRPGGEVALPSEQPWAVR